MTCEYLGKDKEDDELYWFLVDGYRYCVGELDGAYPIVGDANMQPVNTNSRHYAHLQHLPGQVTDEMRDKK